MPRWRRPRPRPTRSTGLPGVILPFPGGVVRSGSKVGSRRIKSMIASTNDAYCPTLRAMTASALPDGVNSVLEIVINGIDAAAICRAMRAGIDAACREGVVAITAGNYGGKLGPHHFHLRKIMRAPRERRSRGHPQGADPRPRRLRGGARAGAGARFRQAELARRTVVLEAETHRAAGRPLRPERNAVRADPLRRRPAPGRPHRRRALRRHGRSGERMSGTRRGSGWPAACSRCAATRAPGRRRGARGAQGDDRRRARSSGERRARSRAPACARGCSS